ncbi:MAG: hypothetical protein AAGG80_02265, partial [Pseudomonadota bacterium]
KQLPHKLAREILTFINTHRQYTTTAQLIEATRGTRLGQVIQRLALITDLIDQDQIEATFIELQNKLQTLNRNNQIDQLMQKAKQHLITDAEKILLQTLLQEKIKS